MLRNKAEVSYILILREAFFAVLDVRFAIDELLGGFHCVLLVCNLSAEKVAGLRWVREGIGRIDLPGESLIKRSHNTGPVQTKQLRACHGFFSFFLGSGRCLCASRRSDGRQPLFTSGMEQTRLDTSLVNMPQRVDGVQQPGKIERRTSEFFAAISCQFCPGVRQTGGLEVSIVALICIQNTLSPLFSFADASLQRR